MFAKGSKEEYRQLLDGVRMRTLVYGEKTLMSEFLLAKGYVLPRHAHPQEQTGYLVRGHLRMTIGEALHDVLPGDSWSIPGGVEHRVEMLEDSVVVEVFSPVREDYLPEGV